MLKKLSGLMMVLVLLTSCAKSEHDQLKMSATTWIGYSPLFYTKEKDWLVPLNIKRLHISSLSENRFLFQAGNADVGTQHEYSILPQNDSTMLPMELFDRSYGGGMLTSNLSLEALKALNEPLEVYLEMDSVNSLSLKYVIESYGLADRTLHYMNHDQARTSLLQAAQLERPSPEVTYVPYNVELVKQGFSDELDARIKQANLSIRGLI